MLRVVQRVSSALAAAVRMRDFEQGDAAAIERLLSSSSSSSLDSSFDPEGPLAVDCATDAAIQEWYGSAEDDGCVFLVAQNDDNEIVGTAGLVVGTTVSYQATGASRSTPAICTGAVRRVSGSTLSICQELLQALETRAAGQGVDELIVLAYPAQQQQLSTVVVQRPTAHLLESLGYQRSDTQLRGTGVIQYAKRLIGRQQKGAERAVANAKETNSMPTDGLAEALIAGVLVVMFIATTSVAQFMGLDVFSDSNQGLGSPLSSQDLNRLQQEERLQRTKLDEVGRERQWQDLSLEEQREELALMKVIQGQDIRVK
eukprot:scaffold1007_cov176-Amphora_coffeaeformis.AAC.15